MTYRDAFHYMQQHLLNVQDDSERKAIIDRTLEYLSSKTKWQLITDRDILFKEKDLQRVIAELKEEKPIQYILGFEYFGDLILKVNEHVLIPRPETQELCDWILSEVKQEKNELTLLDIGTGSGCIPVYLKRHFPKLHIEAWDISSKAIDVAKENALRYEADIHFYQQNLFETMNESGRNWHVIVSNPPYIRVAEKNAMAPRVLQYEPHEALFVTDHDEQQFYKAILNYAKRNLKMGGYIFLEVHQDYALATEQLFLSAHCQTELRTDMYGNNRMLKAWW